MAVLWDSDAWRLAAEQWIAGRLQELGVPSVCSIEVARQWSLACVLRVSTPAGDFYFKAVPGIFAREPTITAALAQYYPGHVPEPVAIDATQGWVLMRDMGGQQMEEPDLEDLEAILTQLARMQIQSVAHIDDLLAAGCADRRLFHMPDGIRQFVEEVGVMALLEEGERTKITSLLPRLVDACAELESLSLPQTLVHGDLHLGNICKRDGDFVIFDWTDACISCPLFDLNVLLDLQLPKKFVDDRERLRRTYLDAWSSHATPQDLERASTLAGLMGAVFQVITYWRLVQAVEGSSEPEGLERMLGVWVRAVIRLA